MNEANIYAQDDWRIRETLTLNLGLRYEYVEAPQRESRSASTTSSGADKNNIEPRLGFAYAPEWDNGFLGEVDAAGPSNFSIRGGWGIYDGRLFQSIFSQSGANVRFNPPNALSRTTNDAAGHPQCLGSDARLRVRARSADRPRGADAAGSRISKCRPRRSGTYRFDRVMPWNSTLTHQLPGQPQRQAAALRAGQPAAVAAQRARSPSSTIPNNAPAAGFPGSARQDDRLASPRTALCAGTGFFRIWRRPRPARTSCRSPTTKSARACRGRTSGGPIRSTRPTC